MTERVPLLDLAPEIEALEKDVLAAVERVVRSGRFTLGPEGEGFEREVAAYLGVRHAVGLNSGTDALVIGLRGLGVGPGDEVITTAFSFVASGQSIRHAGAAPVFADIDPQSFNLDPSEIDKLVTERTRAVLPVHLFGHPADVDPMLEVARARGLRVLEDAAQAFGAAYRGRKVGALADAAALSFYPTKTLGAYGDGGMLVTDDDGVAETARKLRNHGARDKYHPELLGYNSRLDEIQAAILRLKLRHLDAWNDARCAVAKRYAGVLGDCGGVELPIEAPWARHVYHQYTVRIAGDRRDDAARRLDEAGIATAVYYRTPLHRLPVMGNADTSAPAAERAAAEVLSLPIWPSQAASLTGRIASELQAALREAGD